MDKKSKRLGSDSKITGGKIWIEIELEINGGKDDDPIDLNKETNECFELIYWESWGDFVDALRMLAALSAQYYGDNHGPFSADEVLRVIEQWKELNV